MDIKEQHILGDAIGRHWYYRAKGSAMRRLVGSGPFRHVLDVGAGSGFFSRLLLEHGAGEATCVDPGYAVESQTVHAGHTLQFVQGIRAFDGDLVLMMDVLEHVDDDTGLLREYADKSRPGTRFLISVPAFMWMWSGHDVFLEHRRRYTLTGLDAVVRAAGLSPLHLCYFYGLSLPLAAVQRGLQRLRHGGKIVAECQLKPHSAAVNAALDALCRLETGFFQHNTLAGLTVFCLAEKP